MEGLFFIMRRTMISGLLLVIAAALTMLLSSWLDLELESTALLGISMGAVLALVPGVSAGRRIAGFVVGVAVSVIAYFVRAGYTPDSVGGRTVYIVLAVFLCAALAALSVGRLPLWTILLGAGAFAGAFESTYAAAPPRVVDNSVGGITTLLMCVAIGFLAASVIDGTRDPDRPEEPKELEHADEARTMEEAK